VLSNTRKAQEWYVTKNLQLALILMMAMTATGAAIASEPSNGFTQIASILPGNAGISASPLIRVQSNYHDRCVLSCKVSYNICRDGRGRRNNNVCVQELNECLPGC
jgi:hypothetical protein